MFSSLVNANALAIRYLIYMQNIFKNRQAQGHLPRQTSKLRDDPENGLVAWPTPPTPVSGGF